MTIILSNSATDFTTTFSPPIILPEGYKYELGLLNFDTYNSMPNVDDGCNSLKFSIDNGITWQCIDIPQGAYEIEAITGYLHNENASKDFHFIPNFNTGKINLESALASTIYDFADKDSIGKILGFSNQLSGSKTYTSDRMVNISNVNQFLIQCDIIKGSTLNGKTMPVLYSFNPAVPPGYQINEKPLVPVYMPITTNRIDKIRIWITDQENNILNLRGENMTLRLHIRRHYLEYFNE
jgi:hypothetical protein